MTHETTLQELYDRLYMELASRARAKGDKLPTEVEVFAIIYKDLKAAVMRGDESHDALEELAEVKSFHIREEEEQRRKLELDKSLRHGYVIDFDQLK